MDVFSFDLVTTSPRHKFPATLQSAVIQVLKNGVTKLSLYSRTVLHSLLKKLSDMEKFQTHSRYFAPAILDTSELLNLFLTETRKKFNDPQEVYLSQVKKDCAQSKY